MIIELIEYHPTYLIPENGKYLVKTITNLGFIRFLEANCKLIYKEKQKRWETSIDVSNQKVILISKNIL